MTKDEAKTEIQKTIVKSIVDTGMEDGSAVNIVLTTLQAQDERLPINVSLAGTIGAVSAYLEKRSTEFNHLKSHIEIDREDGTIRLTINEDDEDTNGHILGQIITTDDLRVFKINSGHEWTVESLGNFVKMNRASFESKEAAMMLHSELKHFRAKVNKAIEKANDGRGNTIANREQSVETNLPENFILEMKIFKGEEKLKFEVEVSINPTTLDCQLNSPDLKDYMTDLVNTVIDRELGKIAELAPAIVIIEK